MAKVVRSIQINNDNGKAFVCVVAEHLYQSLLVDASCGRRRTDVLRNRKGGKSIEEKRWKKNRKELK